MWYSDPALYATDGEADETFTFRFNLVRQTGNRSTESVLAIREEFKDYVNNEDAVDWQHNVM